MSPAQRVGALAVGLAGALLGLPAGAQGQSLDEAERLYRDGRLDEALAAFESLRQRGGDDAEVLSAICARLGTLRAGAGDEGPARDAFLELLAVRPAATPPPDVGPAVGQVFAEARREAGAVALHLVLETPLEAPLDAGVPSERSSLGWGGSLEVRVGARGGAARVVATTRLDLRAGTQRRSVERQGAGPHSVSLPMAGLPAGPLWLRATLLDADRWTLAAAERSVQPGSRAEPPPTEATEAAGATPLVGRWWLWTGAAALVAGGVIALVLATSSEDGAEVGAPSLVGGR